MREERPVLAGEAEALHREPVRAEERGAGHDHLEQRDRPRGQERDRHGHRDREGGRREHPDRIAAEREDAEDEPHLDEVHEVEDDERDRGRERGARHPVAGDQGPAETDVEHRHRHVVEHRDVRPAGHVDQHAEGPGGRVEQPSGGEDHECRRTGRVDRPEQPEDRLGEDRDRGEEWQRRGGVPVRHAPEHLLECAPVAVCVLGGDARREHLPDRGRDQRRGQDDGEGDRVDAHLGGRPEPPEHEDVEPCDAEEEDDGERLRHGEGHHAPKRPHVGGGAERAWIDPQEQRDRDRDAGIRRHDRRPREGVDPETQGEHRQSRSEVEDPLDRAEPRRGGHDAETADRGDDHAPDCDARQREGHDLEHVRRVGLVEHRARDPGGVLPQEHRHGAAREDDEHDGELECPACPPLVVRARTERHETDHSRVEAEQPREERKRENARRERVEPEVVSRDDVGDGEREHEPHRRGRAHAEEVHAGAARHRPGAGAQVGAHPRLARAHGVVFSDRTRNPSAAITKKSSDDWTNAKASKTARLTPKPAHAAAQATSRSPSMEWSRLAVLASFRTVPQTNQRTPTRPMIPRYTSVWRYWSSKMIAGSAPVLSTAVRSLRESARVTSVPSERPSIGCSSQRSNAGPRSAIRPEPSSPARTCCCSISPPCGVNAAYRVRTEPGAAICTKTRTRRPITLSRYSVSRLRRSRRRRRTPVAATAISISTTVREIVASDAISSSTAPAPHSAERALVDAARARYSASGRHITSAAPSAIGCWAEDLTLSRPARMFSLICPSKSRNGSQLWRWLKRLSPDWRS